MTLDSNGFVLIVDDTCTNLAVLSEALSDAGFETAVATSGERALKQIERRSPDLILLDIMMPGIDGFETCRRLKQNPQFRDIPVIFMTALADVESKIKGFDLGAVDYITKPFQEREVMARVHTHLKLRQTQGKLRQSEARLEGILNSLDEIVWSATLSPFRFLRINPVVEKIYGHTSAALIRRPGLWLDSIHTEDRPLMEALLSPSRPSSPREQLPQHEQHKFEYRIHPPDGELRWLQLKAQVRFCPEHHQYIVEGIAHDISDRKRAESQLKYTACHDDLTGLVNRNFFLQAVDERLAEAQSGQSSDRFSVLFIDLDRFKVINDSLGHQQGDQLLIKVAALLKQSVRPVDVVARLGGDEFTILLRNLCNENEAQVVIQRLQSKLNQSLDLGSDINVAISASIGVVMGSSSYASAHEMLRDADIAMYQAKKLGKACHQLFSEEMYEAALAKINLERDLRAAVDAAADSSQYAAAPAQILLYYQPIYRLLTRELVGFEALVRWHHPENGLISPIDFIPLAEETGLIVPLGKHILRQAMLQLRRWKTNAPPLKDLSMSINLSSRQLQEPDFLDTIDQILAEAGLSAGEIKLEITESLLMQGGEAGLEILNQLRSRGFSLSLDDFGTGYSSLSYLHRFPVDTIKVDRSFIQKLEPDVSSYAIVRSITDLARNLQMQVIAEGVETQHQWEHLKQLDCEMVQGYLFSKPLSVEQATVHLAEHLTDPLSTQSQSNAAAAAASC